MSKKSLIWQIPVALIGAILSVVMIILTVVISAIYDPDVRKKVLNEGIVIAREYTGLDIDLGDIYLSPLHHSPLVFYHAFKGEVDIPLLVEIDSLYIGHRGQDTMIYTHTLRVDAKMRTADQEAPFSNFTAIPIDVEQLLLDQTTFHSDSMIPSVGIDAIVDTLEVKQTQIIIAEGKYPLKNLRLYDADVAIDLRETPPDTTQVQDTLPAPIDTVPMRMAFEAPNGDLKNVRFRLTPLGLEVKTDRLRTNVLADVGGNIYDARRIDIGGLVFCFGDLRIPADTIYGHARVELANNSIVSKDIHVKSKAFGAQADLSKATMDLETMHVEAIGDVAYANDLVTVAGAVDAVATGFDPETMKAQAKVRLKDATYDTYDLSNTSIDGTIDTSTDVTLTVPGLDVDLHSPMPLFTLIDHIQPLVQTVSDTAVINAITSNSDLTVLDTIRTVIPALQANIHLSEGSPVQAILDSAGVDLHELDLSLHSDTLQTALNIDASTNEQADGLPAANASMNVTMTEGKTKALLKANTHMSDSTMGSDLCDGAAIDLALERIGKELHGEGKVTVDSLSYDNKQLGNRTIDIHVGPSEDHAQALRVDVETEDLPLDLVNSFVTLTDIDLKGAVKATASIDGLPKQTDISADVTPLGVSAAYKPYEIGVSLGETPIVMRHNHVDLNGLPIYGVDSTYLALKGGLDLDSMRLDVVLAADSFAPIKLKQDGPFPVYGEFATDLHGTITGPLNDIVADVDVSLLPVTDISYPIDKKNFAQVKPHGTVNAHYGVADGALDLGGQINVDDGTIRYSPRIYPVMPFRIDSGSQIAFNGPVGKTRLDVSASQKVKADVESDDQDTRRVDFITGVRVKGELDSIGLSSIGFFLEAPDDEEITHELATVNEETREGLAATLLATGMYVGESNGAVERNGYALSSIINSRINAALANSKVGKVIDIDVSSGQSTHAAGKTNDMNISISKSFLKDRLRITIGSTITDNPEVNEANGLLTNFTADYKLTKDGNVLLRLFSQRDYNNVLEGELYKSGLAVRATKDWKRMEWFRGDSIQRTYGLTADAGVAYRSNNSIGPDLTLKSTIKNVLGKGESFTLKGNGAYFWALRNRHPGDPKKTDTYKLGVNASLVFPYLHWAGDNNPEGDTRYMLGYQYENIAGGYGVHKMTGSLTYFFHSPNNPYITHAFTPFSLSVVRMKAETDSLLDKAAEYPQLIKVIAGDEFIPSIAYNFVYNNYRSKRAVNTYLNLGVKESGNLINALYCAFGHKWDEVDKPLGKITFNQFVKVSAELRNKFNFTDQVCIATRLFAGANIPLGNSLFSPLSEAFYTGGPNSLRASSPYAYGPGNFYSAKYNQNFFHSGDVKLEANFELRFPIVWKLYGAAFLDAGNVWNWFSMVDLLKAAGMEDYIERLQIPETLRDGIFNNPDFARQIALGTGAGLRLDIEGLVIRLDIGVGIHAPYQTYRYDKEGKPDPTQPITTYFNMPSALDAIRINFGIGYPF